MSDIVYINEYTPGICSRGIMGMVAREDYEETSLGIGNGILRGIMELEISGMQLGNILMIVVRGQLL